MTPSEPLSCPSFAKPSQAAGPSRPGAQAAPHGALSRAGPAHPSRPDLLCGRGRQHLRHSGKGAGLEHRDPQDGPGGPLRRTRRDSAQPACPPRRPGREASHTRRVKRWGPFATVTKFQEGEAECPGRSGGCGRAERPNPAARPGPPGTGPHQLPLRGWQRPRCSGVRIPGS